MSFFAIALVAQPTIAGAESAIEIAAGDVSAGNATWAPRTVSIRRARGTASQVQVLFVPGQATGDWRFEVNDQLRSFVTATPASLPSSSGAQQAAVDLTIDIPFHTSRAVIAGIVSAISEAPGKERRVAPLPIQVSIAADTSGQLSLNESTVAYVAPPGWYIVPSPRGLSAVELYSEDAASQIDAGSVMTPPDLAAGILELVAGFSFDEFVSQYSDGWFSTYDAVSRRNLNGADAIVVDDSASDLPRFPMRAAFVNLGANVLVVTGERITAPEFEAFLAGLRF